MSNKLFKQRVIILLTATGLLSALLWSESAFALDPKKALTQYIYNKWEMEDGLPQNTVNTIIQTRDGYLWLGTHGGLVRFDGVQFTTFDKENTAAIKNSSVWALLEDRQGNLWIGTLGGLIRFRDGEFTAYTVAEGLAHDSVYALAEDRQGNLWIGTGGGLSQLTDGKFTTYTVRDGLSQNIVRSLYEDRKGNLWIGTQGGGVNRFKDGRFTAYTKTSGLSSDIILSICEDYEGRLWIGTYGGGLNQFKDGKFSAYAMVEGAANDSIYALLKDRDGNLWVGTDSKGLTRLKDGKLTAYTVKDGLSDAVVRALYEDREGNLWVGARGGGLNQLKDGKFTTFSTKEGLSYDPVFPIYEDSKGNLWIGTDGGGLNRFKDGIFTNYTTRDGLANNMVWSVYEDHEGSLWIGTNNGLSRFKDGKFTTYTTKDGLTSNIVWSIYADYERGLWIGTNRGLNRLKDGKFTAYTVKDGLSDLGVRYIYEDRERNLWIGTNKGLTRWKDGKFTIYTSKEGLSHDAIKCIYQDPEGSLWIGTDGGGLNRLKDGIFTTYNKKDGLFDNAVYEILDDGKGNLWLSSNRGPYRLSKQELEDFAQKKISSFTSSVYTKADGLSSTQCSSGAQPMGYKTRDGKLWFPTAKGIAVIDPNNIKLNDLVPSVFIEQVMSDNQSLDPGEASQLPPGREKFEFHYTALSLVSPEKVRFKYKLEGFDKDWVEADTRRVAYYTNIPPGPYRFRVMACNNDGLWNETGDSFAFSLQPHFYQTNWFYGLCICAAGLLITGAYGVRVKSLKAREQQLALLVNERTTELREQRSFLRKVMDLNPSFIFAKDRAGRYTLANRALAEAYGTSVENLIGRTDAEFSASPQETEKVHQDDLQVIESKIEKIIPQEEFTDKNGDLHWMQVIKIPITSADGQADQMLGVATDITLQKQAAVEMLKAKEAAEASTRAKSEFLANMSHEIRTPMNGIMGMTELAFETALNTEQQEYLGLIKSSADSLMVLIDDILDFSKIEAGKLELDCTDFSLRDSLSNAIKTLALRAHQKGLELACDIPPEIPDMLLGDSGRVRQIIVNLVGNAIKFTDRGEVVASVRVESQTAEEVCLHFAVSDTGIGISADKQELIFEAFEQADGSTTRKYGGTGLGLAISSQLVKMMSGKIWVESQLGSGSTFHFTARFAASEQPVPDAPLVDSIDLRDMPVLIVDDNATNRRILEEVLNGWQMKPTAVDDGAKALIALRLAQQLGKPYQLVLLDYHMPGMDGFTVAEQIRQDGALVDTPIILLTSAMQSGMAARCRQLRFAGYLTKPVSQSDLLEATSAFVGSTAKLLESAFAGEDEMVRQPQRSLRILLAEDHEVNQMLAVRMLEKRGHRLTVAGNGRQALACFEKESFDLILMDVQMPEMNGLEATSIIRQKETALETNIPIIAMTARAMKGDREECLAAGMNAYISKPIQFQELFETIESLIPGNGEMEAPEVAKFVDRQSAKSATSEPVILNAAALLAHVSGDLEFLHKVVNIFFETCPDHLSQLRDGILHKDSERVHDAAHTLKGVLGSLQAQAAFEVAMRLEKIGRSGNFSDADQALVCLEQEIELLKPALLEVTSETAGNF